MGAGSPSWRRGASPTSGFGFANGPGLMGAAGLLTVASLASGLASGAFAIGAFAIGALASGALAEGALAGGPLAEGALAEGALAARALGAVAFPVALAGLFSFATLVIV